MKGFYRCEKSPKPVDFEFINREITLEAEVSKRGLLNQVEALQSKNMPSLELRDTKEACTLSLPLDLPFLWVSNVSWNSWDFCLL